MSLTIKRLVAWNFIFGALLVFGYIVYGALAGLPINLHCRGFTTNHRSFNAPAWLTPAFVEAAFLFAFFARNYFPQSKVRFFIAVFSAWSLVFALLVPILQEQINPSWIWTYTADQGFWTYAALSNIAYAVVGPPAP